MKSTDRAVIVVVLIAAFCGTFALAQTAKTKTDAKTETGDWRARAEEAIQQELSRLNYYYKTTDEQKAKLKKVLIAQYKDLMDYDKLRAPKIKVLDDEIAALQKKIDAIEKRKAVHTKAREELLLDHKAEVNNVFGKEQRIARLSRYIRSSSVYSQYWGFLDKADQDSLTEQCNAAAEKLIEAGKEDDRNAVYEEFKNIRPVAQKMLTPKIRRAGDAKYLMDSIKRSLNRVKLTEAQLATVRDMCDKSAKRKAQLHVQYEQIEKDRAALRRARSDMSSRNYYRKITKEVIDTVLTEEQRKAVKSRRR